MYRLADSSKSFNGCIVIMLTTCVVCFGWRATIDRQATSAAILLCNSETLYNGNYGSCIKQFSNRADLISSFSFPE